MKSYADDLPNAERTLEEVEKLTQTVIDANRKSTRDVKANLTDLEHQTFQHRKELKEQYNELFNLLELIEMKQHKFRLFVMSGLSLTVSGLLLMIAYVITSHLSLF